MERLESIYQEVINLGEVADRKRYCKERYISFVTDANADFEAFKRALGGAWQEMILTILKVFLREIPRSELKKLGREYNDINLMNEVLKKQLQKLKRDSNQMLIDFTRDVFDLLKPYGGPDIDMTSSDLYKIYQKIVPLSRYFGNGYYDFWVQFPLEEVNLLFIDVAMASYRSNLNNISEEHRVARVFISTSGRGGYNRRIDTHNSSLFSLFCINMFNKTVFRKLVFECSNENLQRIVHDIFTERNSQILRWVQDGSDNVKGHKESIICSIFDIACKSYYNRLREVDKRNGSYEKFLENLKNVLGRIEERCVDVAHRNLLSKLVETIQSLIDVEHQQSLTLRDLQLRRQNLLQVRESIRNSEGWVSYIIDKFRIEPARSTERQQIVKLDSLLQGGSDTKNRLLAIAVIALLRETLREEVEIDLTASFESLTEKINDLQSCLRMSDSLESKEDEESVTITSEQYELLEQGIAEVRILRKLIKDIPDNELALFIAGLSDYRAEDINPRIWDISGRGEGSDDRIPIVNFVPEGREVMLEIMVAYEEGKIKCPTNIEGACFRDRSVAQREAVGIEMVPVR